MIVFFLSSVLLIFYSRLRKVNSYYCFGRKSVWLASSYCICSYFNCLVVSLLNNLEIIYISATYTGYEIRVANYSG